MRICSWIVDDAENQDAGEQQKLNQEQPSGQHWTTFVETFGYYPSAADRKNKHGNGQDLRQVGRPAPHQKSGYYHQVSSDVSCEQLEVQETNHVHHACNYAEHRWKAFLPTCHIGTSLGWGR